MTSDLQAARGATMRAVHHAYCVDTGCFDGDDISNPEIDAALDTLIAEAQREAVAALRESVSEAAGVLEAATNAILNACTARAEASNGR